MHRVGEKLEDLPPFLQEVEVRILQAEFIVPTPSQITHYSKPERAEPPESSQPIEGWLSRPFIGLRVRQSW